MFVGDRSEPTGGKEKISGSTRLPETLLAGGQLWEFTYQNCTGEASLLPHK